MDDSNSEINSKLVLAKWTDRLLAWLVDFIIISAISATIIFGLFETIYGDIDNGNVLIENIQYIFASAFFFVYWIVLEYKTSQSIGKKILRLRIVSLNGQKSNLKGILLSGFGKSFLLPIDVILGWILTNQNRQRVFNKIGDTIIIKIKESEEDADTTYMKD